MTNKRYGRIGDAPMIGAGTWADDRCGVSGTGWGEFYHPHRGRARHLRARGLPRRHPGRRCRRGDQRSVVPALGGDGGAIALDRDGNIAMPFNTSGMYRGWMQPGRQPWRGDFPRRQVNSGREGASKQTIAAYAFPADSG